MQRTPDHCFEALPDWPYSPMYLEGLPELLGARLHYVDLPGASPQNAKYESASATKAVAQGGQIELASPHSVLPKFSPPRVALCLHGNPSWGYLYRKMAPVFSNAGLRVVIPDLVGFGRSDKPELESEHRFEYHRNYLLAFIKHLDLRNILLVVQDWGGILGLTLPMAMPERFTHLLVMNTTLATGTNLSEGFMQWRNYCNKTPDLDPGALLKRGKADMSAAETAAFRAPFPDASYKAALRAFPNLVPDSANAPGAALAREACEFWQERWQGKSFMAIGAEDPVLGTPVMESLHRLIRNCPDPILVKGGHFLQEWGAPIAQACLQSFHE